MHLRDRFTCSLVCKAWSEAATAATHSIILKRRMLDPRDLHWWMLKNGDSLKVLQLHACCEEAQLALPCCAKLQDLLLLGTRRHSVYMASRTWGHIASATKLTSLSLSCRQHLSRQTW